MISVHIFETFTYMQILYNLCVCLYQFVFYFHIPNYSTESCIADLENKMSSSRAYARGGFRVKTPP